MDMETVRCEICGEDIEVPKKKADRLKEIVSVFEESEIKGTAKFICKRCRKKLEEGRE